MEQDEDECGWDGIELFGIGVRWRYLGEFGNNDWVLGLGEGLGFGFGLG
jgi:hypothetical protein